MTKPYIEPKIVVLGRECLAQSREVLKQDGEVVLNTYLLMAKRAVSYNYANAIVLNTVEQLQNEGFNIQFQRGKGYIITNKETPTNPNNKIIIGLSQEQKETICKICHKHFSTPLDLQEHIILNHAIRTPTPIKSGIDNKQLEKAIKEAKAIKAKGGMFYNFAKKWSGLLGLSETKVMEIVMERLEA